MAIILSKQERAVMQAVYELADGKHAVLIGQKDIMDRIKPQGRFCFKRPKDDLAEEPQPEAAASVDASVLEPASQEASPEETKKRRKRFFRRFLDEDASEESATAAEPKVYVDDPPVYKGLRVYEKPVRYEELPHMLEILYMEEYFEVTPAVDNGETKYVVQLLNRGLRWERDERDRKRNVVIRILTIVATPILSFILGIVLRTWFGS